MALFEEAEGARFESEALPCSRIFWIAALRLGFRGRGGGGTECGVSRVRRARWVWLRAWSSAVMAGVFSEGQERAFVAGSRWSGRRVKVSSIVSVVGLWMLQDQGGGGLYW